MAAWVRGLVLALLGACALTGCGSKAPTGAGLDAEQLNAIASSGPTVAEVLAEGNDTVAAVPAPAGFDHLGTWAWTPAACGSSRVWRFAAATASADDGTRCRVTGSEGTGEGAKKLALACSSEGHETIERWALVRREDGGMTVARTEGGNGVPRSVTLRRCG